MSVLDPWVGTWRPHKSKGPIAAQYGSPRPIYMLPGLTGAIQHDPTKPKSPAFSIMSRRKVANADCSPRPIYTLPPNYTRYGKDGTLAFSVHGRLKPLAPFCPPGPGRFSKLSPFKSPPAYTLSSRPKEITKNQNPGYNKSKNEMKIKRTVSKTNLKTWIYCCFLELWHSLQTPGQAAYNATDPYISKTKPPHWTMRGRNFPPYKAAQTTEVSNILCSRKTPSFSFEVRHSQHTVPLIVNVDEI
uniref:Uncharacterized protein n=1 Tax=Fundulus heteroclitus TaxID=8078 RepID=A0A3Q2QRH6_FUNHE